MPHAVSFGMGGVAQNLSTVQGTVLDDQGNPVVGASVFVKGTNKGASTDATGAFTLQDVKVGEPVVFAYIGLKTREVPAAAVMNVTLRTELIDEIIVTAFGTAKKSAFTGSATVMNAETIERKQVTSVLAGLAGEVPGLQVTPSTSPNSTPSMLVRGRGSINAGSDPLIVLDGIPYDGSWNSINPADVENVTVLKDAASSALYGARGANGVILITTKKGKPGNAKITFDARWGVNSRGLEDYDRITNPGQYYELHYKALYNSYINDGMLPAEAHRKANTNLCGNSDVGGLGYQVYAVPEGEYLIGTNGRLNPNATLGNRIYKNGNVYTQLPDDWTDETYRNGFRQEYNLSIAGGSEKAQIYTSFGYLNNEGIVASSRYERISSRLRATYQAKKWLFLSGNISFAHSIANSAYSNSNYTTGSVFTDAMNIAPIYPLYVRDGDGHILRDKNGKVFDWGNGLYAYKTRPVNTNHNSLNSLLLETDRTIGNNFTGDAFADIILPKGFKVTVKGGAMLRERRAKTTSNPYYGYSATTNGGLTVGHYRTWTYNFQQLLTWSRSICGHNIELMAGHENYDYTYETLAASKTGAVDFKGNTELNGYLEYPDEPSSHTSRYNSEGYMFRAMWDYDERFFAQASYRRDASSRFHPDNRWGNFWSLGGAWILSREKWFDSKWINMLKIKASYGEVGNDDIGSYRYVDTYEISNVDGEVSLGFSAKGNRDISWETVSNLNAGVEFELFDQRLNGTVEVYNKKTTDMLLWFTTPTSLGYSGYYKNIGDMRNLGVEVTLDATPVRTKNIEWKVGLNFSYNDQKVVYLPDSNKTMTVEGHGGYQNGDCYIGEGLPLNTWYIAKSAGLSEDGRQMWYDQNGNPSTSYGENTKLYLIDPMQRMMGGFSTSLRFYGVDISAQFTYGIGGKYFDAEYAQLMTVPNGNLVGTAFHKDILKAWTPENTQTDVARWNYGDQYGTIIADKWLVDASYLNFQNFQVGYTLPRKWTRTIGIDRIRIYVAGENLWLWSQRKGYDPRYAAGYGTYSPMRTISGGINIQF